MKKQIEIPRREFALVQKDGSIFLEFDDAIEYVDLIGRRTE